jgi:hypothetical protein
MKFILQSKTLLLYVIFIFSVFQITTCKKDSPTSGRRAAPTLSPTLPSPRLIRHYISILLAAIHL